MQDVLLQLLFRDEVGRCVVALCQQAPLGQRSVVSVRSCHGAAERMGHSIVFSSSRVAFLCPATHLQRLTTHSRLNPLYRVFDDPESSKTLSRYVRLHPVV